MWIVTWRNLLRIVETSETAAILARAGELLGGGQFIAAEQLALKLLAKHPTSVDLRVVVAKARFRQGLYEGSSKMAESAVRLDPGSLEAMQVLVALATATGRTSEARDWLERIVDLFPDNSNGWNHLGLCHNLRGDNELAVGCFERAISIEPDESMFEENLANTLIRLGRPMSAVEHFLRAVELDPTAFEALVALASQLVALGRIDEAVLRYRQAAALGPDTVGGALAEALALIHEGLDLPLAKDRLLAALVLDPDNGIAHSLLGCVLQSLGSLDLAEEHLAIAIEMDPSNVEANVNLVIGRKILHADLSLVENLNRLVSQRGRGASERRLLCYALGKACADLGTFSEAMRCFDEAHRIERVELGKQFDRGEHLDAIDAMIRCRAVWSRQAAPSTTTARPKPIFIVGMMRSGTTLVEQIISNHPDVTAGGELDFWPKQIFELARSNRLGQDLREFQPLRDQYVELLMTRGDSRYVTDKLPENYRSLGLLLALFPDSPVIHCRRNPRDTCLSIYSQPFLAAPNYVHDKGDLAFVYRQYERLMQHWISILPAGTILDVDYEGLVQDPRKVIPELVAFCGLDWSEGCLQPETNRRSVNTASRLQVRRPLHSNSVGRWHDYAPWLGAFLELTRDEPSRLANDPGPLLSSYAICEAPKVPSTTDHHLPANTSAGI